MAHTLTWLHLSDLHFQSIPYPDQNRIIQDLFLDIQGMMRDHQLTIDLVFITGDIAFKGLKEEYRLAHKFFEALCSTLGVEPQRIFMVPGNHDGSWDLVDKRDIEAAKALLSPWDPKRVDELLRDIEKREHFFRRQAAFRDFSARWSHPSSALSKERAWFTVRAPMEVEQRAGRPLWVVGLNSAWLCWDSRDHGRWRDDRGLIIGRHQVLAALEEVGYSQDDNPFMPKPLPEPGKEPLTIVLTHHPLSWLAEGDEEDVRRELFQRADFHLRGHLHRTDVATYFNPDNKLMTIAAGSVFEGYDWRNGYNIVRLDFSRGSGEIWLRVWGSGGFWTKEGEFYQNAPNGHFSWNIKSPESSPQKLTPLTIRVEGNGGGADLPLPW